MFVPTKEERVFFSVYPDSIEEFTAWLPSDTGPFDQAEFASMTPESIQVMKDFAQSLRWGQVFRVRDVLSLVSAQKVS